MPGHLGYDWESWVRDFLVGKRMLSCGNIASARIDSYGRPADPMETSEPSLCQQSTVGCTCLILSSSTMWSVSFPLSWPTGRHPSEPKTWSIRVWDGRPVATGGARGAQPPLEKFEPPPLGCPPWHFIGIGIEVYSPPGILSAPPY